MGHYVALRVNQAWAARLTFMVGIMVLRGRRSATRIELATRPGLNSARKVGENGQYSYVGLQKPCGQDRRSADLHDILRSLGSTSLNDSSMTVPT